VSLTWYRVQLLAQRLPPTQPGGSDEGIAGLYKSQRLSQQIMHAQQDAAGCGGELIRERKNILGGLEY
jgi:hypothetical protein